MVRFVWRGRQAVTFEMGSEGGSSRAVGSARWTVRCEPRKLLGILRVLWMLFRFRVWLDSLTSKGLCDDIGRMKTYRSSTYLGEGW